MIRTIHLLQCYSQNQKGQIADPKICSSSFGHIQLLTDVCIQITGLHLLAPSINQGIVLTSHLKRTPQAK